MGGGVPHIKDVDTISQRIQICLPAFAFIAILRNRFQTSNVKVVLFAFSLNPSSYLSGDHLSTRRVYNFHKTTCALFAARWLPFATTRQHPSVFVRCRTHQSRTGEWRYPVVSTIIQAALSCRRSALVIAGVDPRDVRVVFADGHPKSPFDGAWGKIFSRGKPPLRKGELDGKGTCLRRAVFALYGYSSPMTIDWFRANPCKSSAWLGAFSHQVRTRSKTSSEGTLPRGRKKQLNTSHPWDVH